MPTTIPIDQVVIPSQKWQVTIPKKIREEINLVGKTPLNITADNGKITMVPIRKAILENIWTEEKRKKLLKALKETRGIWADDWTKIKKRLEKQRKVEIIAAKKTRKAW